MATRLSDFEPEFPGPRHPLGYPSRTRTLMRSGPARHWRNSRHGCQCCEHLEEPSESHDRHGQQGWGVGLKKAAPPAGALFRAPAGALFRAPGVGTREQCRGAKGHGRRSRSEPMLARSGLGSETPEKCGCDACVPAPGRTRWGWRARLPEHVRAHVFAVPYSSCPRSPEPFLRPQRGFLGGATTTRPATAVALTKQRQTTAEKALLTTPRPPSAS